MKKWFLLAAVLPVFTWFVAPFFKLYPYRDCYSENVYISVENSRDVMRVSRFWVQSLGEVTGSYQGSLYVYQDGRLAERKSQLRTFNALIVPGRKAVEFRIENVGFISGIHDDDPHFKHYLDPYMQPGLRSHLHLFSGGQNKLMAGLSGRPRLVCNRQKKIIYPLR